MLGKPSSELQTRVVAEYKLTVPRTHEERKQVLLAILETATEKLQ